MELYNYENIPIVLFSLAVIFFSERIIKVLRNDNRREESDIKTQDFILDLALKLQKKVDDLDVLLREQTENVRNLETNLLVIMNEKDKLYLLLKDTEKENIELKKVINRLEKEIIRLKDEIRTRRKKENE